MMRFSWLKPFLLAPLLMGACASPPSVDPAVRLIGHHDMPAPLMLSDLGMANVPFGGISGIDRDPATGLFYLISDDRSRLGPARFLTARIDADRTGIRTVTLLSATVLRDADGRPFPPAGGDRPAVDPEEIRFDGATGSLIWTSEGDAPSGPPLLTRSGLDGRHLAAIPLPAEWRFDPSGARGPRPNNTLEGLALLPDGSLMLAMEGPLIPDGPLASPDQGALIRLTRLTRDGTVLAQYAYPLDPIPRRPAAGKFADNGVSAIARLDEQRFLVMERAGIQDETGGFGFDIRIYLADLSGADDIAAIPALAAAPPVRAVAKRRLFGSDQLPPDLSADNQEGMVLFTDASGGCLLLTIADDNFTPTQHNRLLLFALDGVPGCGGAIRR